MLASQNWLCNVENFIKLFKFRFTIGTLDTLYTALLNRHWYCLKNKWSWLRIFGDPKKKKNIRRKKSNLENCPWLRLLFSALFPLKLLSSVKCFLVVEFQFQTQDHKLQRNCIFRAASESGLKKCSLIKVSKFQKKPNEIIFWFLPYGFKMGQIRK